MIFSSQLPTVGLEWWYVMGEVRELVDEVKQLNFVGIVDELCDVYTCSMCAIGTSCGIPMPIFWMRTWNRWARRVDFFKWYLSEIGLEFKMEYLRYGSNYERAHKRRKVFELARDDQLKEY